MRTAALALALVLVAAFALAAGSPASAQCLPPLCVTPTPTPVPEPTTTPQGQPPNVAAPVRELAPVTGSVTEGVDPGHTNWVPGDSVVAPLRRRWVRRLSPGSVLSGDGRLYVVAGGSLRALDPATGRDVWAVPVAPASSLSSFDAGRLFVVSNDGEIVAHAAADGATLWSRKLDPYSSFVSLVGAGGVLYASVGEDVVALDGATGEPYWSVVGQGSSNPPAIDADGVYVSYACGRTNAWNRLDGALRWKTDSNCSGGGGSVAALAGGRVYVPDNASVYDTRSGARLGPYPGGRPVLAGGTLLLERSREGQPTRMTATDLATGKRRWRQAELSGTGLYEGTADPIALGEAVYTLREGVLAARSVRTGALLWTDRPPIRDAVERSVSLAAAPGLLLVGGGRRLTAYESFFTPRPGEVQAAVARTDVFAGATVRIAGQAGSQRRTGRVTIEVDRAGRGGFRAVARPAVRPDGSFSSRLQADRNLRVRAVKDGVRSRPVSVFVYPRFRFRVRQSGGRAHATVTITGAHDVRLAGRRAVVYIGRHGARRYQRLGSAPLRSAGRGRATGSVSFAPLSQVGDKDFLAACVPGQVGLGLGRAYDLTRHCGAASVRFRR